MDARHALSETEQGRRRIEPLAVSAMGGETSV